MAPVQGAGVSSRPSVDSIVWDVSKVTLSLLPIWTALYLAIYTG